MEGAKSFFESLPYQTIMTGLKAVIFIALFKWFFLSHQVAGFTQIAAFI